MKRILLIAAAALLLSAPGASAAPTGTFCDSRNTTVCLTVEATDTYSSTSSFSTGSGYINSATRVPSRMGDGCPYVWQTRDAWIAAGSPARSDTCVRVGTTSVTHQFTRLLFSDVPEQDRWNFIPAWKLVWYDEIVEGVTIGHGDYIINDHLAVAAGTPQEGYCAFYRAKSPTGDPLAGVALDRTPASIYTACAFQRHLSDVEPVVTTPPTQSVLAPAEAARCGSVGQVTVRSMRMSCAPARSLIARYARTLRSPDGWSCRAVVTDAGRRASCVRKTVARSTNRATVYGIWRPSRL